MASSGSNNGHRESVFGAQVGDEWNINLFRTCKSVGWAVGRSQRPVQRITQERFVQETHLIGRFSLMSKSPLLTFRSVGQRSSLFEYIREGSILVFHTPRVYSDFATNALLNLGWGFAFSVLGIPFWLPCFESTVIYASYSNSAFYEIITVA